MRDKGASRGSQARSGASGFGGQERPVVGNRWLSISALTN